MRAAGWWRSRCRWATRATTRAISRRGWADWVQEHRQQLPSLINPDLARDEFRATYPFHPMVISVFERKWRSLPRFQQTRGILRLLALWVSSAYQAGYKGAQRDPMITLGTAPLDDPMFRAAMFEQLGQTLLEAAVTTDTESNSVPTKIAIAHLLGTLLMPARSRIFDTPRQPLAADPSLAR